MSFTLRSAAFVSALGAVLFSSPTLAEVPASAKPGAIIGTVRNPDGSPAAGATVGVSRRGADQGGSPGNVGAPGVSGQRMTFGQATVGRDGTFAIKDVPAGSYDVAARGRLGKDRQSVVVPAGGAGRVGLMLKDPSARQSAAKSGAGPNRGKVVDRKSGRGKGKFISRFPKNSQ